MMFSSESFLVWRRHAGRVRKADNMEKSGEKWNWSKLLRVMAEVQESPFMAEMLARREASGSASPMGKTDAALLYALARWARPRVVVETGGFLGMSSAFLLKAMADAGVQGGKLLSIEWSADIDHGSLIPENLRSGYEPLIGRVEDFMKSRALPETIDFFLHDSSHRLKHMLKEFRYFYPRLRPGGVLASHDVDMSAAFTTFVTETYVHDKLGQTDVRRTSHDLWGRLGNLGFVVKSAP